jgi:hypothetical protein
VLRFLAFVPLALAAVLRRVERRTLTRLTDAAATTPERAILLEAGGVLSRFVYGRLTRAGALVFAGNDRYYLNAAGYERFERRRRRRATIVVALIIAVAGALYMRGDFS